MASLFSLDFFSCFAFLITVPQLDCPYPHQFSEKIPFHILFSFSLCIFVYSTLHLRPLPHRQVRALGSSCAAKLPIFSSEVLPALHPLSKFLPGLLPYVRLAPAARSSVHAFAFSWLRNRSGHQSWLVCTIVQQHLPGRCVLPPQALLPGCGPDGKSEGAARGPPARTHQAAGERASGFAAGARATLHPRRGLGGGGCQRGWGREEGSGGLSPGLRQGPSHPHAPRPGSWREGEGALVPLQVGMETALQPLLRALYFCLVGPQPREGTARLRGFGAQVEGEQTWVLESPIYLQSVNYQSVQGKMSDLLQSYK